MPTKGYLCAIYVFIMSPFTQSGDVTMADQLDPHFPLAALSLFDKGQQTLPSQRDKGQCVTEQLLPFSMSVSRLDERKWAIRRS